MLAAVSILSIAQCGSAEKTPSKPAGEVSSAVVTITSEDQFRRIIETSGDRLLVFDLYADWCMPCRILSPILESIAAENRERVSVYKINIDKNPSIAAAFGVQGIPYVVFAKNRTAVHALMGVQPKAAYVRVIDMFAGDAAQEKDRPDGELVDGVRVIRLAQQTAPRSLYVYRGETVRIVIGKVESPWGVSIPEYRIEKTAAVGEDLTVEFKAEKTGVFPIFCNGRCPAGDGSEYGRIVVMDYAGRGSAAFKELSAAEASAFIAKENPLVLDVRTPNEYYDGRLKGAKLIPLQQLKDRISEIEAYRDKPVLVYCRSGNRSVVAAQILHGAGFKQVNHIRTGIVGWKKEGYAIEK